MVGDCGMDICEVCGNEKDAGLLCPFCGHKGSGQAGMKRAGIPHRTVNLEVGMPTVEQALDRLEIEMQQAHNLGVIAVTIIHGYGSSGKGGKIKKAARRLLCHLQEIGAVRRVIYGENFSKKNGASKALLKRVPSLHTTDYLGKGNKGITIVEM